MSGGEATSLGLGDDDIPIVVAEAGAAARLLGEPMRSDAARLAAAAEEGEVPAELLGLLGDIAAASLEGGRARQLYRAEGEKALQAIYLRTPRGKALKANIDEINTALVALNGRTLDSIRVGMRTPGSFTVRLAAEGVSLTLAIAAGNVVVDNVTVG